MKIVRGALIIGLTFFLIITLISLLIPSNIFIAKSINVQSDSAKLYSEISNLKNWKHWHPVFINDSAKIRFSNPDTGVNSYAAWPSQGKEIKLIITSLKYPSVSFSLQRSGENDLLNVVDITPINEGGNMQVQWKSNTKLKWYPWEKFSGIFIEKLSGEGYEVALKSLKNYVETAN